MPLKIGNSRRVAKSRPVCMGLYPRLIRGLQLYLCSARVIFLVILLVRNNFKEFLYTLVNWNFVRNHSFVWYKNLLLCNRNETGSHSVFVRRWIVHGLPRTQASLCKKTQRCAYGEFTWSIEGYLELSNQSNCVKTALSQPRSQALPSWERGWHYPCTSQVYAKSFCLRNIKYLFSFAN